MDILDVILAESVEEQQLQGTKVDPSILATLDISNEEFADYDPLAMRKLTANIKKLHSQIRTTRESIAKMETSHRMSVLHVEGAISTLLRKGIEKVWSEDAEYQRSALREVFSTVRHVPEDLIDIYINACEQLGIFVNFTDGYLYDVYGEDVYSSDFGLYNQTRQDKYAMRVMIPLRFLDGDICGFIGYSPFSSDDGEVIAKYVYPNADTINKSRIMFCGPGVYAKAIQDGYICIVDGIFDAIILNALGINAAALCGSALTVYHRLFLSKIQYKIVIPDNDTAGMQVVKSLCEVFGTVRVVYRDLFKDIDDYLKDTTRMNSFVDKFNNWKRRGFVGDLYIHTDPVRMEDISKTITPAPLEDIEDAEFQVGFDEGNVQNSLNKIPELQQNRENVTMLDNDARSKLFQSVIKGLLAITEN